MRKVFLAACLMVSTFYVTAQKIEGEFGPLAAVDVKSETFMFGGSLSLKAKLKGGESIGAGVSGFYQPKAETLMLPVYADLRIPFATNVELVLQPGYTIYENSLVMTGVVAETKGSFYAGGGITGYSPMKNGNRFFFQTKYNYFSFKSTVTNRINNRDYVTKTDGHAHVISLGLGVTFGNK